MMIIIGHKICVIWNHFPIFYGQVKLSAFAYKTYMFHVDMNTLILSYLIFLCEFYYIQIELDRVWLCLISSIKFDCFGTCTLQKLCGLIVSGIHK